MCNRFSLVLVEKLTSLVLVGLKYLLNGFSSGLVDRHSRAASV
jgi:hypothetical protein